MATCVEAASNPGKFSCWGTGPFWEVTINDGKGVFSAFGYEEKQGFTFGHDDAGIFDGFSTQAGQWIHGQLSTGQLLRLAYFQSACSDNMSDQKYEYIALLEHPNGTHLAGCCGLLTTYRVTGVEDGDTLNVRTQPYAGAEIVDKLDNGTSQLQKIDCRESWCKIKYKKEIEGWVNAKYIEEYRP
jgi:uncharacterized membrane protein